jgi:hypothetical protein
MVQTPLTSECDTMWYLNVRAINHMKNHKHHFAKMIEFDGTVSFEDAFKAEVKGNKKVKFLQKNRKLKMVENVYYILKIKSNILSVGQLMKKNLNDK